MLILAVVVTLVIAVVSTAYVVKHARPVTIVAKVTQFMAGSGLLTFLNRTRLTRLIHPKAEEISNAEGHTMTIPTPMMKITIPEIGKLKVRQDDIFLVTFPKAGSTWLHEIVWLICNNADVEAAKRTTVTARVPFAEAVDVNEDVKGFQAIESWPHDKERLIKTHVPYWFLPKDIRSGEKCRIIYLTRNPKDTCVSCYFFQKMNLGLPDPGAWNDYLLSFCDGRDFGSWFDHTLTYWKKFQEKDERFYFTTYEALKLDLKKEVLSMAEFLKKDLTQEQAERIADHCSFKSMSKNSCVNYEKFAHMGLDFSVSKFMRKGQVGDWKNYFTLNQNDAFNAMYEEKMKGSGLCIPQEI